MKLHLGCGYKRLKGFVNIDLFKTHAVDLVLDIGKQKLPYEDNSVDYIQSEHVFEHLHWKEFHFALKEIHRVLKPTGKCYLLLPYATSLSGDSEYHAFRPRYWVFKSFDDKFNTHEYELPLFTIQRKLIFRGKYKPFSFFNHCVKLYEYSFLRYMFPAHEIKLIMVKK